MPQQFASETAGISGESKAQINRHLSRAAELGPDLDAVYGRTDIGESLHPSSGTTCPTLPATGRGNVQFAAETAANADRRMIQF